MDLGKSIECEAAEPVSVRGNAPLLEALLRNLVANAIRHGGDRCRVRVTHAGEPGEVRLEVEDSGSGPPPEERGQLGRRFHRGATARSQGSGLGLSIVARIAQIHGATVEFGDGDGDGSGGRGFRASVAMRAAAGNRASTTIQKCQATPSSRA